MLTFISKKKNYVQVAKRNNGHNSYLFLNIRHRFFYKKETCRLIKFIPKTKDYVEISKKIGIALI
jgi:hypothetical protein